ncbi:folate-binding protein [bacterium]|nr:folate-binding protein [bacterium]
MDYSGTRALANVKGKDSQGFLQGLLSIDVDALHHAPGYALLLTPQGKFLHGFFIFHGDNGFVIDADTRFAPALWRLLSMYRLRAEVEITPLEDMRVIRTDDATGKLAFHDPRHDALGLRCYEQKGALLPASIAEDAWQRRRLELAIPEAYDDMMQDKALPMEFRMDRLHAIDFRKGCYVGQEVTARSKHRATLHKQIYAVTLEAAVPNGTEIHKDGKLIGTMFSNDGAHGIAMLRTEHATTGNRLECGETVVTVSPQPGWMTE